ncbi:MAG: hypothetical protein NTV80_12155, partial [Verrucomicrobia bacterium]|nr:hypothetical protein [Verrucomicrobiota bacterium]
MKLKNLITTLALSLLSLSAAHAAAPINDSAAKAIEVTSNYKLMPVVNLSTASAATTDPLLSGVSAGKTVWYRLPHTANTPWTFWTLTITSTTGVGSAVVYTQEDVDNPLTSLANPTSVSFAAAQGVTLSFNADVGDARPRLLMLAGTGSVQLTVRSAFTSRDFVASAFELTGNKGTLADISTKNGTVTADEPAVPNGLTISNTVWFKWTPAFNGTAAVDTNFSVLNELDGPTSFSYATPHNTVVAVYRYLSSGLAPISADDDGGYSSNSRVVFVATSGFTYYICVGTKPGTTPGNFDLNYYQANSGGEISFRGDWELPFDLGGFSEAKSPCYFKVVRRYAGNFTASATLATDPANSTATAGSDYQAFNISAAFANPSDGTDNEAWLLWNPVTIVNDNASESAERVGLKLSAPVNAVLGSEQNAYINIVDDEPTPSQNSDYFSVKYGVVRIKEDASITNTNELIGNNAASAYATISPTFTGTASGNDFVVNANPLYVNQDRLTIDINAYNDDVFEADETAEVRLAVPGNPSFTVIIEDDDAFIPSVGKLVAGLRYGGGVRMAQCYATISAKGVISGKLTMIGQTMPFVATLDRRGKASVLIVPKGRPSLHLSIAAQDATGGFKLSLFDSATNTADTVGAVLQNYIAVLNPCPEAGRYTLAGSSGTAGVSTTVLVTTKGTATLVGRLFDGTAFTTAGYVDGEGKLCAVASVFAGQGC